MWKRAVRGKFYRPAKKAVSLRLDAHVIGWLKKVGRGIRRARKPGRIAVKDSSPS
jgi:uncharacterized protein (DUF4415 family)